MTTNRTWLSEDSGIPSTTRESLYTEVSSNPFKGDFRPPLAKKDHNILPSITTCPPSLGSHTLNNLGLTDSSASSSSYPFAGPPLNSGFKTYRALPDLDHPDLSVHYRHHPKHFEDPFGPASRRPVEGYSTYSFPLTPPDRYTPIGSPISSTRPRPLLPSLSLGQTSHSRDSSLNSLWSSIHTGVSTIPEELSPLETEPSFSRNPFTHPSKGNETSTIVPKQEVTDEHPPISSKAPFASKRRFTHISDPGSTAPERSYFYLSTPPPPRRSVEVSEIPSKAPYPKMSVLAMRADPLLSEGVVATPYPVGKQENHDVVGNLEGWILANQQPFDDDYQQQEAALSDSRDSLSSSAFDSLSDDNDDAVKGQRAGDPLIAYNNAQGGQDEESQGLWSYDAAINALVASTGVMHDQSPTKHGSLNQNTHTPTSFPHRNYQASSPFPVTPSAPLKSKTMFAPTRQEDQQGMTYPSHSMNMGERPLPTPSSAVPIGGEHLQFNQTQQPQYLVPVLQRGEHLFYDPEYPITSAASYTFGATAHQQQQYAIGHPNGQGGRQTSVNYGAAPGSRSATEALSHQNLIPGMPRSYHGYPNIQQDGNAPLTGPISAFPGSIGQLPSALGSAFPHLSANQYDNNSLTIPTHQIQPRRSHDNMNSLASPLSAYPQTPSPQKRGGSWSAVPFDHIQTLRSAAPEPEGPSAFMRAYQGGCTPQSVAQSRQPPSSMGRPDDIKMEVPDEYGETSEYEVERMRNIRANEQLMESLGLGSSPIAAPSHRNSRSPSKMMKRKTSSLNIKAHPGEKKNRYKNRVPSMGPVRSSTRLASMSRNVSYAGLDGRDEVSSDEGSFDSNEMDERDEDWDGSDSDRGQHRRRKHGSRSARRQTSGRWGDTRPRHNRYNYRNPTLRELFDDHLEVREVFPLFYNVITEDMVIDNNTFPLIGSVPTSCGPVEKATYLQQYFHKGRRAIAQLDAFTARCDKRYDGPGARWTPLSAEMKIAIRDIRRKAVERCENYKYTRRDLLNKHLGKGNWAPIEDGWIPWTVNCASIDPANDLDGAVLASPPPDSESGSQPSMVSIQHRITSRKRSQAFSRKASRSESHRNPSLRLHTTDVFNPGYSDERPHIGVGMPSVPMKTEQVFTPATPQRQQVRYNPMHTQTPLQYVFSPDGTIQDHSANAITPSIVRAARFASGNMLGSPFTTPVSAGGYQSHQGTPTHHFHHINAPGLFHSLPMAIEPEGDKNFLQQESSNSVASHPMSVDGDMPMMTGGIDMSFQNMSEASTHGQETGNGFEHQVNGN